MNSKDLLSLDKLFEKMLDITKNCFCFAREVDPYLIAAHMIYSSIYAIFKRRLFLNINGETASGKSRIGEGLYGGKVNKECQLVEPVVNISHYSEAGVRQSAHNKNVVCCLDEFEDTGRNDEKNVEGNGESLRLELSEKICVGSGIGYGKQKKRSSHKG